MKEPTTAEGVLESHKIRQANPRQYLAMTSNWIKENPQSSHAYFARHQAWMDLDQPKRALADLTKAISIQPDQITYWSRGDVHRYLGEYKEALADYSRGESLDPQQWQEHAFPLLYQADAYARSGNEPMALDCCARLPDDFWTPGPNGTPPGDKSQIADELKRRAAAARAQARAPKR